MNKNITTGLVVLALMQSQNAFSYDKTSDCKANENNRFTFSWPISDGCEDKPRGGTSKGAKVEFATDLRPEWLKLQEVGLAKFERDRRAILAMQGGYKVNFDFLETVGYAQDYIKDRPYQSWGTEYVYVIEDSGNFISLQHVMVMRFEKEDGTVSEPMVMKHWRQDWTYEDNTLLEYSHDRIWQVRKLKDDDVKGAWSQAVFQVDDSPRYESFGAWEHNSSFSTWISEKTRRPLPRREYSVRDDYDLLEGFNRHTVTNSGWVQEEENWKLVVTDNGVADDAFPYVAKEEGLARYRLIKNFDFSEGDKYLDTTLAVWTTVRDRWQRIITESESVSLHESVDGKPMFIPLFNIADQFSNGEVDEKTAKQKVNEVIDSYLK